MEIVAVYGGGGTLAPIFKEREDTSEGLPLRSEESAKRPDATASEPGTISGFRKTGAPPPRNTNNSNSASSNDSTANNANNQQTSNNSSNNPQAMLEHRALSASGP